MRWKVTVSVILGLFMVVGAATALLVHRHTKWLAEQEAASVAEAAAQRQTALDQLAAARRKFDAQQVELERQLANTKIDNPISRPAVLNGFRQRSPGDDFPTLPAQGERDGRGWGGSSP